MYFNRTRNRRK